MVEVVTYHSQNAKPHEAWLAYVVLSSGEQWLVRFHGTTEQEAIDKAVTLWESEKAKYAEKVAPAPRKAPIYGTPDSECGKPSKVAPATVAPQQQVDGGTKYIGVYLHKNSQRWIANVPGKYMDNHKVKYIGSYNTPVEAAKAYNAYVTANKINAPLNEIGE